jgi:hypothetical protein
MGRKPQLWLRDGDVVEVGLENVGTWYVPIGPVYSSIKARYETIGNNMLTYISSTNKVEFIGAKAAKAKL